MTPSTSEVYNALLQKLRDMHHVAFLDEHPTATGNNGPDPFPRITWWSKSLVLHITKQYLLLTRMTWHMNIINFINHSYSGVLTVNSPGSQQGGYFQVPAGWQVFPTGRVPDNHRKHVRVLVTFPSVCCRTTNHYEHLWTMISRYMDDNLLFTTKS